jgi:uncharacterized protein
MNSPQQAPDSSQNPETRDSESSANEPQPTPQEIRVPEEALPPLDSTRVEPFAAPGTNFADASGAPPYGPPAPPPHEVPPDLRVPWGWSDVVLFAFFYLGSAIVVGVILVGIIAGILHRPIQDVAQDKALQANIAIFAQAIGSGLALIYLWILVRVRHGGPFWQTLGWRPFLRRTGDRAHPIFFVLGGIALAVVAGLADQYFAPKQEVPIEQMFQTREAIIMLSLFGILVAPLIEETLFRGFLYPVVGRSFGIPAAVIITGAIFGLTHAEQLWGGWAQIGVIVAVGIVLTWARAARKTVFASFLIHISYNSTIFLVLLLSSSGLRTAPH